MDKLIIIGASGHGKVVADIALLDGYEEIVFLDDNPNISECAGFPVVGKTSEIAAFDGNYVVAIGDAAVRKRIQIDLHPVTLIHPCAVIGRRVKIGEGSVVMAGAVINSDTVIGKGCIINTCSSVDHDCIIHDFVHVSVGAHISGTCEIGEETWIGAGATISNNVHICGKCTIGAGATVIKNIYEPGVYVGVPAERLMK